MKQRVTDEQAKAITICLESGIDCPNTCPNYGKDDCESNYISATDLAADLLEARELVKEMLPQLVYSRAGLEAYEAESTGETYNSPSLNSIIEKAKEYI